VDSGKYFPRGTATWDGRIRQGQGTVHKAQLTTTYDGAEVKGTLEFTFTDGRGQPRRFAGPDGARTVRDTDIWARQRRR